MYSSLQNIGYLQFLFKGPTIDVIIDDECDEGYSGEDDHEVLRKQFTLNVAKCVTRKKMVHGNTRGQRTIREGENKKGRRGKVEGRECHVLYVKVTCKERDPHLCTEPRSKTAQVSGPDQRYEHRGLGHTSRVSLPEHGDYHNQQQSTHKRHAMGGLSEPELKFYTHINASSSKPQGTKDYQGMHLNLPCKMWRLHACR